MSTRTDTDITASLVSKAMTVIVITHPLILTSSRQEKIGVLFKESPDTPVIKGSRDDCNFFLKEKVKPYPFLFSLLFRKLSFKNGNSQL